MYHSSNESKEGVSYLRPLQRGLDAKTLRPEARCRKVLLKGLL